jgi:hypothetical protein
MITFFTCCYVLDISSHCVLENKALWESNEVKLDSTKYSQCPRNPMHEITRALLVDSSTLRLSAVPYN